MNKQIQRIRGDRVWKYGGAVMALGLIVGTVVNSIKPLSPRAYNSFFAFECLIEVTVGYISASRYTQGLIAAALSAAKAALVGIAPELALGLLWDMKLIHPTILDINGIPRVIGNGVVDLCIRSGADVSPGHALLVVPVAVISGLAAGLIGGLIGGRGERTFESRYRCE